MEQTQDRSRSGQFVKAQNVPEEWETGQNTELALTSVAQVAHAVGKERNVHVMQP